MSTTLIFYSLFYLALFIVACMVLTSCVKAVIHEWYACHAMLLHLLDDPERGETIKAMNERIREALGKR